MRVNAKLNIVMEMGEDGRYVFEYTDLPGCLSEGDTPEEAIKNIDEATVGCMKFRLKQAYKRFRIKH
jgi:predicted RNase H-like HicB family nuclease